MIKCRDVKFVTNRQRNASSVGEMLQRLIWRSLEDMRKDVRLVMICKIAVEDVAISKKVRGYGV
jgi:hypothetical protein